MKRFLAALAVAVAAMFAADGCSNNNTTFQGNTGAFIAFLAPTDAIAGSPDLTLTVLGQGFVAKTVVQWNGKNLATTFLSGTQVTAVVPAADIAKQGTATVNSLNPHKGGQDNGLSNTIVFIIRPPEHLLPIVTSMLPVSAASCVSPCAGVSVTLTIDGSNFLPTSDPSGGSVVQWNLGPTQTLPQVTAITSTQITATLTGTQLSTAGCATVTVYNPPPGGGTGLNGLSFTVGGGPCPAAVTGVEEESPALSSDGRYVAYAAADGAHTQVFVRDTCEGADSNCEPRTDLVSAAENATPANGDSHSPSISADGRYVAFSSAATNLASSAPPGRQVYLRDTCFGAATSCKPSMQLVSTDPAGALLGTENLFPSLSASGRFVAFLSVTPSHAGGQSGKTHAPANAGGGANSGLRQVFMRDTCLGATASCTPRTTRISLQPGDAPPGGHAPAGPALSGNSSHVAIPGRDATLLTHGAAIDDRVFLALTNASH